MNERIKEILVETGYLIPGETGYLIPGDKFIDSDFCQKFAELLIGECAEQILAKGTDQVDFDSSQTGIRPEYWDMAQHIKQHFGVE